MRPNPQLAKIGPTPCVTAYLYKRYLISTAGTLACMRFQRPAARATQIAMLHRQLRVNGWHPIQTGWMPLTGGSA